MANITLLGASYTDVPAVTLPKTGGGTVTFYENGGGGSLVITDEANATGTTAVITVGSGPTPAETWETLVEGTYNANADTPYNYFWISQLSTVYPSNGSVWRITADGTPYVMTAKTVGGIVCVGNPKYSGGSDDGSGIPFNFTNQGWGAWVGDTELQSGSHSIKIEQQVSE